MLQFRLLFQDWRLRSAALFLLLLLVLLFQQYSHVLYCETIGLTSFQQIAPNTYASGHIAKDDHPRIREMLGNASARVSDFWGGKKSRARLIICATPREYERYCHSSDGAGCSLGTFYGSSFIVLNLYGLNTDVISHEMCHIELLHRVGWRKTTFEVPQWFNEGLSMMLDYRFVNETDSLTRYKRYVQEWNLRTRPPARRIALEEIESLNGFFKGDNRHVTLAYITAATEVSYWLMVVGKNGLTEWTRQLENGRFHEVYYSIETLGVKETTAILPANPIRRLVLQKPGI